MRVCVVAEYYPRRRDPVLGVWAHRQAIAARAAGADLRVLALERPIPPKAAFRAAVRGRPGALAGSVRGFARQPRTETLDGLEVTYVRFLSPPRGRSYATWDRWARAPLTRALERLHRRWPIDLVHAHYALPAGGAARPFAQRHDLPLVVSVHGGDLLGAPLSTGPGRVRVGEVLRASRAVLCNSRATLERAAAVAGSPERMRVVHLGADPPPRMPEKREQPTLVTLGHVVPRKRHADVLRAIRLLDERAGRPETGGDDRPGRALRWVVIGDGPEVPHLRALAAELDLADRVEWTGQLPPERAIEEVARCHLMTMPSVDEAFGVAYVEALACGVPAIGCSGEGGPEEIAGLGEGMLLVPPRDPAALADAIEAALSDPGRLAAQGEAARRTAAAHFTWTACGRQTVAAYEEALRAPAGQASVAGRRLSAVGRQGERP